MKTFNHVDLSSFDKNFSLPEVTTQTIKGKRFYITPEGNKYPSITSVLSDRNKDAI